MVNVCQSIPAFLDFSNETTIPAFFVYTPEELIVYQMVFPCIIVFGFCTNLSFLWTVFRSSCLHTCTYKYLVSLAMADLLFLCSSGIPTVVYYNINFTRALSLPVVWRALQSLLYICAVETITLVTLERFLAICFPIKHRLIRGSKRTNRLITISWLNAFFYAGVIFILVEYFTSSCTALIYWPDDNQYSEYPGQTEILYYNPRFELTLNSVYFVSNFILLIFNGFMYIRIYHAVNDKKRVNLNSSADLESQLRQVSLMLIINGCVFFICYIAQVLLFIWTTLFVKEQIYDEVFNVTIVGQLFLFVFNTNASINPVLYFITNRRYRKAFKTALAWRKRDSNKRNNINTVELSIANRL